MAGCIVGGDRMHWVKEVGRGFCVKGPQPKASHPEDLCSLAGWIEDTERWERGNKRKSRGGKGRKVHGSEHGRGIAREDWA